MKQQKATFCWLNCVFKTYGMRKKLNVIASLGAILTFILSGLSAEAGFITIGENFTGSTFGIDSPFVPPDTMGSVGPNHIVELINGAYRVYNRDTNGGIAQSSSLDQFWIDAGITPAVFSFDPRIVYDHASERWFAVSVDNPRGPNNFLVAVSNSSDPTAGWTGFSIDSDPDDSHWADFPTLGLDADGVYITANMFPLTGSGIHANIVSIPKSDLTGGTPTVANLSFIENKSISDNGFSIQPAVDFGPSDGRAAMLAPVFPTAPVNVLKRTDLFNGGSGSASLSAPTGITVNFYSNPPNANQPGPKPNIETGDIRFSGNVFESGDSLWAVHNINVGSRAALRWYEIDEPTNTLLQFGTIRDPVLDFFFPSIAANEFGDVVIGFNGSSESQFVSSYAMLGQSVGGITVFGSPLLLKAGVSDYGANRWGDYSATVLDPNDPFTFWTFQEFVSATDVWSTQITQLTVSVIPEPSTVILFAVGILAIVGMGYRQRKKAA